MTLHSTQQQWTQQPFILCIGLLGIRKVSDNIMTGTLTLCLWSCWLLHLVQRQGQMSDIDILKQTIDCPRPLYNNHAVYCSGRTYDCLNCLWTVSLLPHGNHRFHYCNFHLHAGRYQSWSWTGTMHHDNYKTADTSSIHFRSTRLDTAL